MMKVVNLMLCVFYYNLKNKKRKGGWSPLWVWGSRSSSALPSHTYTSQRVRQGKAERRVRC